jgi:hypothetical protein
MIETHLPFRRNSGLSEGEAREAQRLLDDGLLVPLLLDVVVAVGAVPGRDLRAAALRLVMSERLHASGATVAQEAAAWFWAAGPPPRYVDVVIAPGRVRSPWPYVLVHERRMPARDIVRIEARDGSPLAVTSPARTAADLLRTLPEPLALDASVLLAGHTGVGPAEIAACLGAMPRARGVARARRMLDVWPADDG